MSPRTLLLTGLGLLVLGLLLALSINAAPLGSGQQGVVVQSYLSNAAALVGAGLVVVSALLQALRHQASAPTEPPEIDHYA